MVSIIIPVYNKERYINDCLKSVQNQTYKEYEVVVVNDGSTDNSEEEIRKYIEANTEANIRYFYKENGGLSSARNYGMCHSKGDFIFFLDPDDTIEKNAIKLMVQEAGNYDIVVGRYKYANQYKDIGFQPLSSKEEFKVEKSTIIDYYTYMISEKYGINACNKLYRRSFVDSCNVIFQDNSDIYAEDLLYNSKLLTFRPRIRILEEITYVYFRNSESITYTYQKELAKRYAKLVMDYRKTNRADKGMALILFCNAINCIGGQETTKKGVEQELSIFLGNVDVSWFYENRGLLKKLPWKRRIDYALLLYSAKSCLKSLVLYQIIKNQFRS